TRVFSVQFDRDHLLFQRVAAARERPLDDEAKKGRQTFGACEQLAPEDAIELGAHEWRGRAFDWLRAESCVRHRGCAVKESRIARIPRQSANSLDEGSRHRVLAISAGGWSAVRLRAKVTATCYRPSPKPGPPGKRRLASRCSPWWRLLSGSARPPRSSPSSTACCCGRCPTRAASASCWCTARARRNRARSWRCRCPSCTTTSSRQRASMRSAGSAPAHST